MSVATIHTWFLTNPVHVDNIVWHFQHASPRDFASLIEHGGDPDPDPATARVVIDRHALSVACGHALTTAEYGAAPLSGSRRRNGSISRRHYDHVVALFRNAADTLTRPGRRPPLAAHQVQAVTWLVRQLL